jgi:hypothetical protein
MPPHELAAPGSNVADSQRLPGAAKQLLTIPFSIAREAEDRFRRVGEFKPNFKLIRSFESRPLKLVHSS